MEPTAYPVDVTALSDIWRSFMATGKINRSQQVLLDPTVLQSWRRCMPRLNPRANPRLTPVRGRALESVLRAQAYLISIGTPAVEDIYQYIEGSDCAILLADGSACVLAVAGDESAVNRVNSMGLGLGSYWLEGQVGTTALGMVLVNAMPTQVVGPEHFFNVYHDISSSAAPIHDVRGRIVGAICIISPVAATTSHTLALAMAAAKATSNQLQAEWFLQEANQRLSEVNTILQAVSEGVVTWDARGDVNHMNEQAAEILALNPAVVMGMPIEQLLDLPDNIQIVVRNNGELRDTEAIINVNGRPVHCLISLRPIAPVGSRGYIALLRPIEQVRQLVQQQAGAHATITVDDVYGESAAMRQVIRQTRVAAKGLAPILLQGEGGVGKNHLAQAIHNDSQRASRPYLAVNCRAIPHELMATELLGEESENRSRPSKFELANRGTLLLDQIDSLSLEIQAAVLQTIETGHVMRLGGIHPIPVDLRIVVATSVDLDERIAEGSFLPHLYYRFGVFKITIPPLRERIEDISLLAERFLARITRQDHQAKWIGDGAMSILRRYPWPGNVRELESVLERALHQSRDGIIRAIDLPDNVRQGRILTSDSPHPQPLLSISEAEREAIIRAGWACEGRVGAMAGYLQIGRTTLWRKMKRYEISPEHFRN